ncbi:alpha-galactosidase [bacterium]|nr:alpha-galactosidase [bacterium]
MFIRIFLACFLALLTPIACWAQVNTDWLIDQSNFVAEFKTSATVPHRFELTNGLVSRFFYLRDDIGATVGLESLNKRKSIVRAVKPEAVVVVDGVSHQVGGLEGQPDHAFLKDEWLAGMSPAAGALRLIGWKVGVPEERLKWKRIRNASKQSVWPPEGVKVSFEYQLPEAALAKQGSSQFRVFVNYELYDGVPVFCKWITIENLGSNAILVDRFSSEMLAVVEYDSRVELREGVSYPRPDSIHVETDFAFGGFHFENANRHVVHWRTDPEYSTQVNYLKSAPCLLDVSPSFGPMQTVKPGQRFQSFRTFELVYDSSDRERRSLSLRKMYRVIAPWVTENPLMHHMRDANPVEVKRAIDDASEVGFEMVILSFGSGFDIENETPAYLKQWQDLADHAASKQIELGGYSLLSSRRIGGGNDIVPPAGQKLTHGNCPSLTSQWGQDYFRRLRQFFDQTGFSCLEHDGPYPGDVDITERLPFQKGEADSRWVQGQISNEFYRWCRARGIYINAPDYYFLNGTSKCGMGYREVNWSLPRELQLLHARQNIYDGTWYKTPSMGWMFVPLSEYHGGGAAATIEPLKDHLEHYAQMIDSNLGLGVQACYRGPRLFDSPETRDLVKQKVAWFKKYRDILESDVVHGRRPDGRNLDWMLHVNPSLDDCGMLVVYNPTGKPVSERLKVDVYYTGLRDVANVTGSMGGPIRVDVQRDNTIELKVDVPPNGMSWYLLK